MDDTLKSLIKQFMPFAQKQIGFENPPRLFLRRDGDNAKNPLGKTAFYDPNNMSVTLYISGRHPKDILRSLGHELVHHKQNCDGKFSDSDDMGPGYAQKDPHLRQMEQEANRDGSMCLRDFEDMLKKENTIYYEHLQKGDKKMSTKDWKNKEITQLLSEAWGFKFNSLEEFDEFNGSGELQAEGEGEEEIEELARASRSERPRRPKLQKDRRSDDDDSTEKNAPAPPRVVNKGKMEEGEEAEEEIDEGVMGALAGGLTAGPAGAVAGHYAQKAAEKATADDDEEEGKRDDEEELDEAAKPDYIDIDGDGDKEESMKDAAKDKKEKEGKNESVDPLQEAIASLLRKHIKG